jgi:uncharacterized protein (DUF362 family)
MKHTVPCSRREFFQRSLAGAAALSGLRALPILAGEDGGEELRRKLPPVELQDLSARAPALPVAIERCRSYERETMAEVLSSLFDKLGGIEKLMRGKTVTVKLNTTGNGRQRLKGKPAERTYQTHPNMVEAMCALFRRAGAKKIYLVESFYEDKAPEEILKAQGWDIGRIHSAAEHVTSFEDTRNLGAFKDYVKLSVPWGGLVYPAYHLNPRYAETDVLVSAAKLKNHITAGITGAVKNLFGIAPTSLYGNDAPNERTTENRGDNLHYGRRGPPAGVTAERYPGWDQLPREMTSFYRVPRVTADLFGLRPVDLAIVEGVESSKGGEGPWCPAARPVEPGVILAGRNAVTVDAIATAVMGYDPLAPAGEKPWFGDNHLELLARAGAGTHDPGRIEVIGLPLKEALFEYEPNLNGWIRRHGG